MRLYRLAGPAGDDRLTLTEADDPAPGPRDLLVRMRAVSLNYRDLMVLEGRYAHGGVPDGLVPCSDGAGEVVAIGSQVDRFAVGDRIAGLFMPRWLGGPYEARYGADSLGGGRNGVLAEYVVFDQEAAVPFPDHLGFAEAATLPCAGLTAWNALFGAGPLLPGEDVLLEGTGGVSLFALAFARMAGARPIVTTTKAAKRDRALQLGADDVLVLPDTADWPKAVRDLTGGRGVDHVVEVVGGANIAAAARAARDGCQIHSIGALGKGAVDPTELRRRSIVLRSVYVGSRAQFLAMNRAISRARYRPLIDRVLPFESALDAYRHLRSQSHVGKVVIDIGGATS
jgi:NADPH:quinone reductase-like Zn-dependent oxidoreductase